MRIKFLTLNIWQGNLIEKVIDFLKQEDPDIICLQEVYDGKNRSFEKMFLAMDILRSKLSFKYCAFFPAFLDTRSIGDIEQGNAIFSKFPILDHNVTFFDVSYGPFNDENNTDWQQEPVNMGYSAIDLGNIKLNVFNVHGIWGLDGEDSERRLKMSEIIVSEIKDKKNVILAGDFNVRPNTKTIHNIEKYLKNVFKDDLTTTFNMNRKTKGGYATSVVDMIFLTKNIKVLEHFCPKLDISDHFPLVCTVKI